MTATLQNQSNLEVDTLLEQVFASLPWAMEATGGLNKRLLSSLLNSQAPSPADVKQVEALLKALLEQPQLKALFFYDVAGIPVFKKETFCHVFENKEFLPSSYTAYANHIGLRVWGQHLRDIQDVVLDFPYKDCVLEGGQTKEDEKGQEVFYNEVLAPSAISRLTRPKAFNNITYWHTVDGQAVASKKDMYPPQHLSDITKQNLLIKGNNYVALHSLLPRYKGKIKLIYIDPPYNTKTDSFQYNDNFSHSTWLVFMKNRLEVARQLLRDDGSIFISIDDDESHYLKVLADIVFGREHFVNNIIWEKKYAPQNDAKWFSDNHDHILVYAKNKACWRLNLLPRTEEMNARYKNPDNDQRGVWKTSDLSVKRMTEKDIYPIITPSGRSVLPPSGRSWGVPKEEYKKLVLENRIWFGKEGNSIPQLKRFITDVKDGMTPLTIWSYEECGHNQDARREVKGIVDGFVFTTPKPEKLLQRIIHLGSNEGDIVLDYHTGSGTTAAVAHKMNRRWITIEQMDYIETLTQQRLINVLNGDSTGVSKAVGWQGGGSFVYMELAEDNHTLFNHIHDATTQAELDTARLNIAQHRAMRTDINTDKWLREEDYKFKRNGADVYFRELPLAEQKRLLKQVLDKNKLYIDFDNMEDAIYRASFSDEERAFNDAFYAPELEG